MTMQGVTTQIRDCVDRMAEALRLQTSINFEALV